MCRWVFFVYPVMMWFLILLVTFAQGDAGTPHWAFLLPALFAAIGFTWLYVRIVDELLDTRYPLRMVVVAGALVVCAAGLGGGDQGQGGQDDERAHDR